MSTVIMTMKNQVYKLIKEKITNGHYQHGEQLQELEIAQSLGISRSPVREALKQLVGEGLLVDVPNKGVFVRTLSEKEIKDLYDVRFIYEKYAIDKLRNEWSDSLEKDLVKMKKALEKIDYKKIDFEFDNEVNPHLALVGSCQNEFVIIPNQQANTLTTMLHVYIFSKLEDYQKTVVDHIAVIDAILERDFDKTTTIVKEHILKSKNSALEYAAMNPNGI